MPDLQSLIRDIPDFPKPGVTYKDITPLLADAQGMHDCIQALAEPWRDAGIQAVCGIEARGFIFGAALAQALNAGFVPLRKPGKLPGATVSVEYDLEYGTDRLEVHTDAVRPGERVLLADDVLATGGTLSAAAALMDKLDAKLCGAAVVIELEFLHGRDRWAHDAPLRTLLPYA